MRCSCPKGILAAEPKVFLRNNKVTNVRSDRFLQCSLHSVPPAVHGGLHAGHYSLVTAALRLETERPARHRQ